MPEKKLYLLDAMALIYRAYFALNKNPRINSKGQNTSAILGFANSLYDILKNEKPTHIGVAFDTMAPTVRKEEYEEYKATREDMPEDISTSIPYIKELIKAFNIPILYKDRYEADDIIGTLAKKAEKAGFTTYMVTPDKDFGQLVSENIFMYKPARMGNKAEILGVKEVCDKYQIQNPEQLIDILGLWGDASDNIPGVPGIGEKTASKLITEFHSIENLLGSTDKLKGKQKENLETYAQQARMSRDLATIILDAPIEFNEELLKIKEPDVKGLKKVCDELEFRAFANRVFTDLSVKDAAAQGDLFSGVEDVEKKTEALSPYKTIQDADTDYRLVEDENLDELIENLKKSKEFCFDTETTGKDPNFCELVGIAFSFEKNRAYFLNLPEDKNETTKILSKLKAYFEDTSKIKVGQNLKYDIAVLKWYDIEVKEPMFDTIIAHYLIEPDLRHGMDYLANTYLDYKPVTYDELTGKSRSGQMKLREVQKHSLKKLVEYACEDADITLQLKSILEPKLKEAEVWELFSDMEIPLLRVLADMEAQGVKLDIKALKNYSEELQHDILRIEEDIYDMADFKFNVGSPKQLGEVLFEKMKITDKPKLTKTKQYSTSEDVLQKMANKHPIINKILDYRSLSKLKSTYVDALPALINERDQRLHTSYMQSVAATGRLSSQNPNLQNIPIRTEKGREIRKAFVPRSEEYTLLAADYSQIELRIIAHLSQDEAMMEAFKSGVDIHSATASKVYGVGLEDITSEMRRNAKTVNFGIVYGISAFGLSERLNIPRTEARDMIDAYFRQYSGIRKYMNETVEFACKHGYVKTIMGRRRYLRDINSTNSVVRGFAERNAINAPIQGSSADMIKIAMIRVYEEFQKQNLRSKMILQVHDELVFDAHKEELDIIKPLIEEKMKNAIRLSVPVEVDMNTGENWLVAH